MNLDNVTLVAATSVKVEETLTALINSCKGIRFNSIKLLTDANCEKEGVDIYHIPKMSNVDEYSRFMVYDLADYIDTEFAITVQHDGWIINPDKWSDEFYKYDYIGAPWPLPNDHFSYRDPFNNIVRVGNGGFSFRSKKLMSLPKKLNLEWKPYHGFYNEDGFIAIHNKHILEQWGCRYPTPEIAAHFSQEIKTPECVGVTPFGFHKYIP
jgi:hypothetical protein